MLQELHKMESYTFLAIAYNYIYKVILYNDIGNNKNDAKWRNCIVKIF